MSDMSDMYPFSKIIEVMKPSKANNEKQAHKTKLDELFKSSQYIAEPKIDGCHYLNIGGRFFSTQISKRTGIPVEKTEQLPHLVEGLLRLSMPNVILDGEIFYPGWKSYNVTKVTGCNPQEAIRRQEREDWMYYMVFDILRDPEGNWLFNVPWRKRREILETVCARLVDICPYFKLIPVVRSRKLQYLEKLLADGEEGIVLKYVNGLYHVGKRPMWNWVKIKAELEDDVIIMGYEPPVREYTGKDFSTWPYWEGDIPVSKYHYMGWIGAVVFGKYDQNGQLIRLGTCSGITEDDRKEFSINGDAYVGRVIKIRAMERTPDGFYRHPKFIEVHPDKNPHECVIKQDTARAI
jgi:ATP-dependent DNA ligase